MRRTVVHVVFSLVIAAASGSACAMKSMPSERVRCHVVGGDKLPAAAGNGRALCATVEAAAATNAPGKAGNIEVQVLSASSLAATIRTPDGRTLPEQRMATMDQTLTKTSIQRFARAIAAELARTGRR